MRYIIITTPFSGANHIAENLFNLLSQWYGCRNYLHSFLNGKNKENIAYVNGTIYYDYEYDTKDKVWYKAYDDDGDIEKLKRIQLLLASPNHLLTLSTGSGNKTILKTEHWESFISDNNYLPITIERKNKLHQILVGVNFRTRNKTDRIPYFREIYYTLLKDLEEIYEIKNQIPSQVIYYEDFINLGANENALIQLLNLDKKPYNPANIDNRFFEFTESNIIDCKNWREDREEFLDRLSRIG